ncbi:substrate-binding domain-containing protein [Arcanobacterium buesumense]|uniref:Sugar ABC transporter substrate-binding protein n=1 Tax=Arcanobacterium buesumense TaxID=2722751 RepID=A0A6H2EID2_9ACTO|nr:substrate-binding domain-containing protein [Arcanobacterium buesumense]QJC21076.1 sugar ABC transporter substrate-binding protein [Arcanobacterium buesumense]
MKRKVILAVVAAGALSMSACGAIDTGSGEVKPAKAGDEATSLPESCTSDSPILGVLLPNLTNPYYVAMQEGFEEQGKEQGFTVDVSIANDDDSNQLAQAQALLQKKPCAIALNPVNSDPSAAIVKLANDAGVPVFNVNVGVSETAMSNQDASIVQYLGADNAGGGTVIGEQVLKDFGDDAELHVGLVTAPDQTIVVERDDAFKKALEKNSHATVDATVDGKVQLDTALNVTSSMLQGNPDMNVIFASTGPAAQGALEAVKASGRDVKVYGFCASELPLTETYPGCVAQEPKDYGKRVVDQIKTFISDGKVDAEILRPLKLFVTGETPAPGEVG